MSTMSILERIQTKGLPTALAEEGKQITPIDTQVAEARAKAGLPKKSPAKSDN